MRICAIDPFCSEPSQARQRQNAVHETKMRPSFSNGTLQTLYHLHQTLRYMRTLHTYHPCAICVSALYAYPHQCVYATYLRYTRLRATCVFVVHEQALHELPRFMHISQCALSRHFIFLCASCILHPKHMLDLYGLLFLRRNVYLLHRSAPYIPSTQLFLRATSVSPLHERALHGLPRFMPLYLCALSRHFIFLCALCVLHLGSVITAQTEHAPSNTFRLGCITCISTRLGILVSARLTSVLATQPYRASAPLLMPSAVSRRKPISGKTRYIKTKMRLSSSNGTLQTLYHLHQALRYMRTLHIILAPYAYLRYMRTRAICVPALYAYPRYMCIRANALIMRICAICVSALYAYPCYYAYLRYMPFRATCVSAPHEHPTCASTLYAFISLCVSWHFIFLCA
jgi:hypothetical protein